MRKLACVPVINLLVAILFCYNARANNNYGILTLSLTSVDPTCELINGSITAVAAGGTAPYTYSLNGGPFKSQSTWLYQAPGNFTVTTKDANGATASSSVRLTNHFSPPHGNYQGEIPASSCTATDASLAVGVTGGTPPYLYSLDLVNYQASNVFTNLAPGWYVAYAKDANGCLASINTFPLGTQTSCFVFSYSSQGSECGSGGVVDISDVSGGVKPYTYSSDGIHFQANSKLRGLPPGVDWIYIKDATGTMRVYGVQIYDYCALQLTTTAVNADCGKNNGSIQASASDGTEPYQYSIDGIQFQSTGNFTGLAAGSYTVSVKDATGRVVKKKLVITSGCLTVSTIVQNATCGGNNGLIIAGAADGTFPYQYSIDGANFQPTDTFSNLSPGNYTVTVKDVVGITTTAVAEVKNIPGPTEKISITHSDCNMNNGTLTITPIGGTAPFMYSLDNINFQDDSVFTSLYPGSYTGYIVDSNKCTAQLGTFSIYNLCLDFIVTINDASCNQPSGSLTIVVTTGTAPYIYSIDGINFQSSNIFKGLAPGNYTVTVKDNAGVVKTQAITVGQGCITVYAVASPATCGKDNGAITIHASNGIPPYSYALNGNGFQSDSTFSDLAAGIYAVTVKDATASGSAQVNIETVASPQVKAIASAASCANNDGSITATVTGGTGPYLYSFNNGTFGNETAFNSLSENTYTVTVKDANGCLSTGSIPVPVNNNLRVEAGNDTGVCEGKTIRLSAVSDAPTYSWSPATGLDNPVSANPVASPAITTKYMVTASTAVCSVIDSVIVNVYAAPVANAGKDTDICYGNSTALMATGGAKYYWSPAVYLSDVGSNNPQVIKPQQSITYYLITVGSNGCSSLADAHVTVKVTPSARVFAGNDTNAVINQPLQLQAGDIDRAGFTSYTWSPGYGLNDPFVADPVAIINSNITYTVVAATASGCEATDQVAVKVYKGPDIYVPSAFTPNHDGLNDVLKPIPVGIKSFLFLKVFDRWGNMVFYTSDYHVGWTGSIKGLQPVQNTYIWITAGKDINGNLIQRKGTVAVIP